MKPLKTLFFVNGNNIMFYIFASFKQIWISKYTDFVEATIESGGGGEGGKILFGYKRTIRQV